MAEGDYQRRAARSRQAVCGAGAGGRRRWQWPLRNPSAGHRGAACHAGRMELSRPVHRSAWQAKSARTSRSLGRGATVSGPTIPASQSKSDTAIVTSMSDGTQRQRSIWFDEVTFCRRTWLTCYSTRRITMTGRPDTVAPLRQSAEPAAASHGINQSWRRSLELRGPTISAPLNRLQPWVKDAASLERMAREQDQRISDVVRREQSRLRNFIRRRVPDPRDAEDILQDVLYALVEANRLLMPIEHVAAWLFRVARNRITDLFRKKKPVRFSDLTAA